ncbi:LOW QUALITY PROTEIN: cytoplasmic dynein 1 heavy chain 1-like [Sinocyclocheilus anshuiensis]|uniref:LOW QUALITY PROTEIN: cytoplasmic dynein 1 heavy chain 1-like n=1 Tax=Sinocyclocheilus anshuiensis TaxID=1608454 RepID=UPI0007BABBAA|nr:PREDICTED: LOW QUALITY PROTEIN: cytoplasmic dynein 1 heavy chain 1-like [Sinocyclocheilus anshuiensis]
MSDGGGGEDGGGGGMEVSAAVQTVADASVLQKHFRKLVPLLLEDGGDAPASLETALEEKSALEQMRKFLSDPQIHSILVERSALKEDVGDEGEEERECISYSISIDIHYGLKSNSLALIKRTGVIDADKPISTQVRVLTLSEDSPYETLHSFISNAVSPYFKSYIRESGKADRDGDKMAPSVEKKIAELEMGLLHLQQNIEIPEISLLIHPIITNVAKQCYERAEKPKVTDFGDKVEDPSFLNQLQSGVNRWIREIQKVTKLDRDPASGTALQEISFWLNLERALNRIQEKRESPEVLLTLDILKHGKRFHATVSFDTDTGLKQAVETVNDYNPLMKDFPLNDLLSATELDKIRQALVAIFNHLRKIRNTKYPIQRALRLVEAISRDLSSQLLKVLGTRKLMHVAYEEFEKVMVACFEVFQTWEDEYEKLQVLLRDIVKRKREENLKMVWRLSPAHRKLQARLDHMRRFRRQHEQLRAVIVRVLRPQVSAVSQHAPGNTAEPDDMKVAEVLFDAADVNAIEEVNLAYENVKEVDGLDVSKEGVEAWEAAMKRYDERIDRVETRITARLRDQLGTAKNANEMFRIFSRFNALFVRPHIRGAIREYQTQLIQRVKDDIEALHDKFKVQYPQSQSCKMSHVRDLPPVSGSIIWAKQIDRQLTAYMKRVEDVLGKGWENHVEGLKLKQDGDSFRAKLNTQEIFDDWAKKVQQRNLGVSGRIFTIENTRARGRTGTVLKLKVNFLPEIITLSKEVRNLKWLSFRVPLAIVNKAHQANQLYPFAISLIESVRTYERTCEKVEERMSISLLVAGLKKEVQALVTEGISLVWESYKLDPYVQRLAETIFNFQEKVDQSAGFNKSTGIDLSTYINWIDRYQAQLVVLSTQIDWSENVESALTTIGGGEDMGPLQAVLANVKATLNLLADTVLMEQPPLRRKKLEHLITELVHQRDVTRTLIKNKIDNPKSFEWLSQMRFYFDPKQTDVLQQLSIQMANAKFNYGFEYLGVQEKLVQTPLTDRCYLTMTQALEARLGGSPFGPAGTGKTESVKALGHQLGRFVLVFNCDETFDFQAMGRIFVGLCQVGAWGCFDEFNRLEERMLSAVSQQVQYIQVALREHSNPNRDRSVPVTTELLNKQVKVSAEMAIFITMNPGYAGRSNLPDNLKKLFRSLAMTKPDRQLIAQVMLYSQGFRTAEILAKKIVPFFKLCARIMFEVQDLKYATLATVSRCGMVWFSEDVLSTDMIFNNFLARLRSIPLDEGEDEAQRMRKATEDEGEEAASPMLQIQRDAAAVLQPYFTSTGLVIKALEHASKMEHIMDFTRLRSLSSLFSMLHQACRNVALYNNNHHDFPMPIDQLEKYMQKYLIYAVLWSFSGDSRLKMRAELGEYIRRITTVSLPSAPNVPIIDYEVSITGEWQSWQVKVPQIEVETHKVASPDVVVPTLDTVRHEALLYTWLAEHKPLVLCGPPGSGKTMTLFSALRALPDMEVRSGLHSENRNLFLQFRMNTLLANGEVPGLFEGDEYATLMTQCKEGAQKEGLMLDTHEELYKWFTSQVIRNLHVVFTMNPSSEGLKDRAATSPALFNRCVLNWFGDWSTEALYQVGKEFTSKMDLEKPSYKVPDYMPTVYDKLPQPPTHREAIVNGCVFVHQTLHQANNRLAKRGGRTMAITPRHYLDFINHYANLFNEKRSELEEQQMHLNVGLRKIKETVDQVEELRRDLRIKSQELEVKNAAANDKLKKMVKDQQEAEKKKVMSQDIQEAVYKQQEVIKVKQLSVKQDLDQVEPAVIEAQNAVFGGLFSALTSSCLRSFPFSRLVACLAISSIVNFVSEDTSDSIREKMKKNYMSNPSYNYEQVNRASLACGPMVKWAIAQLNYADMLKRVEPLRNELQKLEDDAKDNKTKAEEVEQMIRDLENSIARYKEEYAVLISEAQAIKADLAAVEAKVNRSTALLKSLSAERERWEKTSETFKNQMSTIAGDCLLSAAFIAYAGYFDQQMRQNLFTTWSHHLQQANIQFRTDIARTEYLSNADERLRWQANSLPADDLCTENAIMLKRFNRYPLIIDPSGQATEFIMNEYKDKKITRTSFLDDAFRKNLESALRFGNPLLVQDVESYDPILNPVLNREVRRTGGRVLITLGDQDIDLSPSFVIFLSTRDPTVEFPPDLCSRVTFVNFTVTRSSLQSQCLNEVLKAERPDVDEKRSDLLKLQGEFQLRLRQLEKSLLQALNEVKGRILDDDTIITTLENLKKEAAEVTRKVEETDIIMQEVETVSQQYLSLSSACSSIYFTMEALNQMHFLYQYSLQFFLDIYHTVLYENSNLKSVSDHTQRLSHITKDLFQVAFNRVARGMLHQDHVTFAMLLSRINLKGMTSEPSFDAEFQHFLRGKEIVLRGTTVPKVKGLSSEQSEAMVRLSRLPAFKDLVAKVQADEQFFMWIESNSPELSVPYLWTEEKTSTLIGQAVHQLLLIQAFRPDRLLAMTHIFVSKVMGETFMAIIEQPLDLANIVDSEVKPGTPVLMCSVPGYDASGLVRDLAAEQNKHITSISIGSAEGFNKADRDINTAVKSGRWVMLENVHLAPGWLMQLEKKLHSMQPHACFRLFLTMEINPKVPVNLLRAGRIFVFEPPPGMKANMLRTFSSIPVARMCKSPNERARLYFLLAWFHAVIQERLRYAPLGWSKKYEFGESDLRSACDTVDTWLDDTAKGRQNISPDKIPWAALRTLMAQSIYGGRIDNEFDQRLLNTFLERLFTTSSFDSEFKLALKVDGHKDIKMPDGIRREEFIHWVELLPDTQTPSWLGLPSNAEKVLLTTQGIDMMGKLLKMQMLEDEDDLAYETEKKQRSTSSSDAQPAWMRTLHTTARNWLQLIPESVSPLKRTVENIKDPLFRFFEREVKMGSRMLQDVRQDLTDVVHVCEGKKKQTNDLRTLINDLVKGILPRSWSRYTVPAAMTVIQWVADFSERIKQLQQISQGAASGGAKELKNIHVNLGGLFVPEAYITATRQYVAQVNSWSLEELCLEVNVTSAQGAALDACSFGIRGLKLQGATCANNKLSLSTSISTELPLTQLHWMKQSNTEKRSMVTLPVYLNFTRSDLIFTVDFDIATKEDPHHFYERGVAILCTD